MLLLDLLSDLGHRAAAALVTALADSAPPGSVPAELPVVAAGRPEFGDYQISACLQLGKTLKRQPRQLAELVATALGEHPALAKVEIAGPGFVNLHLRDDYLAERTAELIDDTQLGLRPIGRGTRVALDFSSPNVAKPMHIAHIRSTIMGDALGRVLSALGYDVIRDNHLGDWGTQFGKLIVAYRRWLDPAAYQADAVAELLRVYARYTEEETRERAALGQTSDASTDAATGEGEADGDEPTDEGPVPPVLEEARRELARLQAGDPQNLALWRTFIADSRHVFERIYQRLGVRFDYWLGESSYHALLPVVVDELMRRGIARESRGAKVVFFDESGEVLAPGREPVERAKLPPFIVQKRDGAFNYASTDIATLALRIGLFCAARVIVVTDERQQLHFRQLFAVGRALGISASLEHVWFGLMRMPEGTIKTRSGNVIHLSDLLDEAERRATALAAEVNAKRAEAEQLPADELPAIGRAVGLGAVRYNDLSKDRQTLVTFTWDRALALDGNTAPYLQYAYARIRSILRKSDEPPSRVPVILGSPVERSLAKQLLGYGEIVEQVARSARPHVLCDYLYALATAFSGFYADHPVLKAEPALRASRLLLVELVARVLKHGLGLLGIDVVERM